MSIDRVTSLRNRWAQFVAEVVIGYSLTIYDYTNELAARDILEPLIGRDDEANVRDLDETFRTNTRDVGQPLPGAPDIKHWWWTRVPLRPMGELVADIQAEGLS